MRRGGAHLARYTMGEVGTVDDDQYIGIGGNRRRRGLADAAQDHRQFRDHRIDADDGKIVDRK